VSTDGHDRAMTATSGRGIFETTLAETQLGSPRPVRAEGRLPMGAMVGRYVVLDMLGRGGMGVVYAAYDPELDRKVALKLILPGDDGQAARLRLQREAQAIAQLSHPHVVAVHDVGSVGEQVFIAMEFVEGMDLARWLAAEQRTPAQVLDAFQQAGAGLLAAHAAGLVHRDFKPENVLMGADGRARVVDFGLVRRDDSVMTGDAERRSWSHDAQLENPLQLTDAGSLVGTPAYMSPEQFSSQPGDARSDQFSFCVSLYEGLYGERPFAGDNPVDLACAVSDGVVRGPPAKHEVSGRLRRVLLRGLSVDPAARYPTMAELLAALRRASRPWRGWWAVAGVVGLGGALTAAALARADQTAAPPDPCAGVGDTVRALWSDARKHAMAQAFRDAGPAYAEDTLRRVQPRIDRYLERWTELSQEVCEVHGGRAEAARADDPRYRCLEGRRAELADVLAVLEQADAPTVLEAVGMVSRLSSVEPCADFDVDETFPVPHEPALRQRVDHLRSELRLWMMRSVSGHDAQSDARFEALVKEVEATGYDPLRAEVLEMRADRANDAGRLDDASDLSNEAFETALGSRHDSYAFKVATSLAFLHGVQRREPAVAHRWCRRAEALLRRTGATARMRLPLLSNEASIHALEGHGDQAQALYDEALALARETDDPLLLASLLNNTGAYHAAGGRVEQAIPLLEEAAELNAQQLGPEHPTVLRTRANLGILAVIDGRYDEGLRILEQVLPGQEAAFGPVHPEVSNSLEAMAKGLGHLDQLERALELKQRVLEIRREVHGPQGHTVASARNDLAEAYLDLGRLDEATADLTALLHEQQHQPDADPRLQIKTLMLLSRAESERAEADPPKATRHHEDSGRHAEAALEQCRHHDACGSAVLHGALVQAAQTRLHRGDRAGAQRLLSEALRMPTEALGRWSQAQAHLAMARATLPIDPDMAVAHARHARAALPGDDRISRALAAEIDAWQTEHDPSRGLHGG